MVTTGDHVIAMHGGRQAAVFQRHGSREHADSRWGMGRSPRENFEKLSPIKMKLFMLRASPCPS